MEATVHTYDISPHNTLGPVKFDLKQTQLVLSITGSTMTSFPAVSQSSPVQYVLVVKDGPVLPVLPPHNDEVGGEAGPGLADGAPVLVDGLKELLIDGLR